MIFHLFRVELETCVELVYNLYNDSAKFWVKEMKSYDLDRFIWLVNKHPFLSPPPPFEVSEIDKAPQGLIRAFTVCYNFEISFLRGDGYEWAYAG